MDGRMDGEDSQQIAATFYKQQSKHIISGGVMVLKNSVTEIQKVPTHPQSSAQCFHFFMNSSELNSKK